MVEPASVFIALSSAVLWFGWLTARPGGGTRDIGFSRYEVYPFADGTQQLAAQDLNADGRDDVVFINNRESRMEVLLRRAEPPEAGDPPLLDEAFDSRGMIVDQQLLVYRLADLDGDGRTDLVTFGYPLGLHVRMQTPDGAFAPPVRVYLENREDVVTIQAADLDGDARTDLVVCRRSAAEILWNREPRPFRDRNLLPFADESCVGLETADVNGDGPLDLLLYFKPADAPIRVRLGDGAGAFGLEHAMELPAMRTVGVLKSPDRSAARLGCVLQDGFGFRIYRFELAATPPLVAAESLAPRRVALQGIGKDDTPAWLAGDFDGDGLDDILVVAPERSQLHLYRGTPDGLQPEPLAIDSLAQVTSLSLSGAGDVLAVSRREKAAAVHARGRLREFPALVKLPGQVVAGAGVPGDDRTFFVCRTDQGSFQLAVAGPAGSEPAVHPLDLRNEPEAMTAFRLGGGEMGILLHLPYAAPAMYRLGTNGIAAVDSAAFRALAEPLKPSQVCLPRAGDGDEVVVSGGRTARRFAWRAGQYAIVQQLNPDDARADVAAACRTLTADGPGILLYDRHGQDLIWYPDQTNAATARVHVRGGPAEVAGMTPLSLGGRQALVLVGRRDMEIFTDGAPELALGAAAEYMSESEDPSLQFFRAVALGEPPRPAWALVDAANRSLELVSERGGELARDVAFEVFLDAGFNIGEGEAPCEPHDVAAGDVNADGIGDLAVLVHDRLIVYLGE